MKPIPLGKSMPEDDDGNIVVTHEQRYSLPSAEEQDVESGEEDEVEVEVEDEDEDEEDTE